MQNPWSAERGIGRHVRELALALGRAEEGLDVWYLLNRDLPVPPETAVAFGRVGRLAFSDDELPDDGVYHVPSPLEPTRLERIWPSALRSLPFVVTMHDLIPAIYPEQNMPDAAVRRVYWARLQLLRHADRVLNVSHATAEDGRRLLGLRPERMAVTGGGVSPEFRPPVSRDAALTKLTKSLPEIRGEYVLFTGGMDYRKNVDGLFEAYAGLAPELRSRHQLVVAGRLGVANERGPFEELAVALGISDHIVLTGHVPDEDLVLLYQAAELFVFPSRYEGFGLPVIEALACGASAIVGRNSSLIELVDRDEALFDADDPVSIRAALARALEDPALRDRLRHPEIRERFTWDRIAQLTVAEYRHVLGERRRAAGG